MIRKLSELSARGCTASIVAAATVFFVALPCSAHQKWLWPNRFTVEKAPVCISFDATWSDTAFTPDEGVHDRPLTVIDSQGRSSSPDRVLVGKTKSTAEVDLTRDGTYRLESMDPITYWSRIEKDGKTIWRQKSKDELPDAKILRSDLYWSKALAYVTVGDIKDSPPYPAQDPISITPNVHPNAISAGDTVEFTVTSYGKPLPSVELKIYNSAATDHDAAATEKGDANGVAKYTFAGEGKYLVACQFEQPVKDDPKADLHSFNVYLTLNVRPKKSK